MSPSQPSIEAKADLDLPEEEILEINFAEYNNIPLPVAVSDLYEIKHDPQRGRGIFAKKSLVNGAVLLKTGQRIGCSNRLSDRDKIDLIATITKFDSTPPPPQEPIVSLSQLSPSDRKYGNSVHAASTASTTSQNNSPLAYNILREYKKEVCAECFRYDRGREWKIKISLDSLLVNPDQIASTGGGRSGQNLQTGRLQSSKLNTFATTGLVFCSENCSNTWITRYGLLGVRSFVALEEMLKKASKRKKPVSDPTVSLNNFQESNLREAGPNGTETGQSEIPDTSGPSLEQIQKAWQTAQTEATQIVHARSKPEVDLSKAERKLLSSTLDKYDEVDADVCYYLITGALNAYNSAAPIINPDLDTIPITTTDNRKTNEAHSYQNPVLTTLLTLAPDPKVYAHPSSSLKTYTNTYLQLHHILPLPLLRHLTPTFAHELNSRASHNAFSIRPPSETDGEQSGEFLGWGVWPAASFFNHSCASNLAKRRVGRDWEFSIHVSDCSKGGKGNIDQGEELCITYLGGDEKELDVIERRKRLMTGWGFECACVRCVGESKSLISS